MQIEKIAIKNFRLLEDVELTFEKKTTVIVGRNNSGKTSVTELFRRLLSGDSPKFHLEDFSLGVLDQFWEAFRLKREGGEESAIREALPVIEARLTLSYETTASSLGPLSDFIVDLNPESAQALVVIRYQLQDGKIDAFFEGLSSDQITPDGPTELKIRFFRAIKDRVRDLYSSSLRAVDPGDSANQRSLDWSNIQALLQTGFINAQRGLDDTTTKGNEVLGKILQALFSNARLESADAKDREIAKALEVAVQDIQVQIDGDFKKSLINLLPTFGLFGYPGLADPRLCTETTLDVNRLLINHTMVRYVGVIGVTLPEAYNGLGVRNLIYILLRILEFFKDFKAKSVAPCVHLIFIEEPEAHLHPQMQEVFIRQLEKIVEVLSAQSSDGLSWPVQFVVTTHSSHIANEIPFNAIRYFLTKPVGQTEDYCRTDIKDLRKGMGTAPKDDQDFLHQYMTLTRCDLFFADKAVLIEGPSERLLLPRMIRKVDAALDVKLASQYISTIEIGGAFAHLFFKLLEFLELRSLIITDLDSGKENAEKKTESCKVSEGTRTTNACLKNWFNSPDISPQDLIQKTSAEKTRDILRLAFQVPEAAGSPCGRSFEDAFILANPMLFGLTDATSEEKESEAWKQAKKIKKTEFALQLAIGKSEWTVPRYIAEGLHWLAQSPSPSTNLSSMPPVGTVTAPEQVGPNV